MAKQAPRRVEFIGTIADFVGAIRYAGNGDFMRVTLEIPRTEFGNSAGLLGLTARRVRWIGTEIIEDTVNSGATSGDDPQF